MLAGIAIWSLWGSGWSSSAATEATDFSAVPAVVNFEAPEIALNDLSGARHALSEYKGQVVLVNLWATWCPPCKAEMPILQRFYEAHKLRGFVVVAIEDGDPEPQVRAFVASQQLTFPIWLDPTYEATDRAFKTRNLPSSYVVDRVGKVRLMWFGAINEVNLTKFLVPLIKE